MFKIGEIYVPKVFFDKLKDAFIGSYAEDILKKADGALPIYLQEQFKTLAYLQYKYPELTTYLTALIRIQTEDYILSDIAIEASDNHVKIMREANRQAQIEISKILPADLTLLASMVEEFGLNTSSDIAK